MDNDTENTKSQWRSNGERIEPVRCRCPKLKQEKNEGCGEGVSTFQSKLPASR